MVLMRYAHLPAAITSQQSAAARVVLAPARRLRHAGHIGVNEQRGRVSQSASVDKLYVRLCRARSWTPAWLFQMPVVARDHLKIMIQIAPAAFPLARRISPGHRASIRSRALRRRGG